MKTRNLFPWMAIAILFAGGTARAQESAPAASATVPVTTQSTLAANAYEMALVQREDRLFVDEGLEFCRQAVKADPEFALGHAALGYFIGRSQGSEGRKRAGVEIY